jgi:Tfp pilus assembly protein PilX
MTSKLFKSKSFVFTGSSLLQCNLEIEDTKSPRLINEKYMINANGTSIFTRDCFAVGDNKSFFISHVFQLYFKSLNIRHLN